VARREHEWRAHDKEKSREHTEESGERGADEAAADNGHVDMM
jgi:hypothetical protein